MCTEKQKLIAATTIDAPTPPVFQGYENSSVQLPVAQVRPCAAVASARAFATGAVAVALPAQPYALPQPISGHALGLLQHGEPHGAHECTLLALPRTRAQCAGSEVGHGHVHVRC